MSYDVKVEKVIKGEYAKKALHFRSAGWEGGAVYKKGEKVLLFLHYWAEKPYQTQQLKPATYVAEWTKPTPRGSLRIWPLERCLGLLARPQEKEAEEAWGPVSNGLRCRLLPKAQVVEVVEGQKPLDAKVHLTYELQNVGKKAVKFLPYYTPLEEISGDIFTIVGRDGKKVRYWGASKERPLPRAREFLSLAAGGKVVSRYRLPYDFSKPGRYRISVTTQRKAAPDGLEIKSYYGGDAEKAKQNPDNVWRGSLKSNTVTVDVVRPGKAAKWGKAIEGVRCGIALDKAVYKPDEPLRVTVSLQNVSDDNLAYVLPSSDPKSEFPHFDELIK